MNTQIVKILIVIFLCFTLYMYADTVLKDNIKILKQTIIDKDKKLFIQLCLLLMVCTILIILVTVVPAFIIITA